MKKMLLAMLAVLALTISVVPAMAGEDQQTTRMGTAIVIDTKYYLDTDGDGIADIRLDFGPLWYTPPPPSTASRPSDGDYIEVFGKLTGEGTADAEMDVYEINGEFWRTAGRPPWAGANPLRQGPKK